MVAFYGLPELRARPHLGGQSGAGRKAFFFKKKNQKTFTSLGSLYPERPQPNE
jgi:hypothetical protein